MHVCIGSFWSAMKHLCLPQLPRTVFVRVGCCSLESAGGLEATLPMSPVRSVGGALCGFSLHWPCVEMCMFHKEFGFLTLFTLFEDGVPWSHYPSSVLWAGGEGQLCPVPNLPHPQTSCLSLCCPCLALWILDIKGVFQGNSVD